MRKRVFLIILVVLFFSTGYISAHPWGGLVIDQQGNVYFTFICPLVDDDHYACVWKIDEARQLSEFMESSHSPSDIILARTPDRMIYAAERNNAGTALQARLWKLGESEPELIIEPTTNKKVFFIQTYAVDGNGTVYFARDNQLFKRNDKGTTTEVKLDGKITRLDDLAWGANDKLYILDRESIKIMSEEGGITTLTDGLKKENPENLPFSGANILFDFAVDEAGNVYVAYYGNRQVLKVSAKGEISVFLQAEGPWSPHGIDVLNGEVFVLESTFGTSKWWEFWEEDVVIPRIRKVDTEGNISTVFEYELQPKD